ncbi:hypothetical protein Pan216_26470 [Planctomycetes bacterium Pan216]|uniref:Retropepsin-like aspartic endopeptidase domain-containing protein n=1 Tax=Kolteria novifilia TaxID=2527975 RepID=A0A518B4B9_9BACT|nr:hypothetical protein Pan216_26470 [Planctomycetes bacterium Pan216]
MVKRPRHPNNLAPVGWREWVALPDLGVPFIKAKVDTGARSSTLHAFDIHYFDRDGVPWVRFSVHPIQRDAHVTIQSEAKLLDHRAVRSSSGHQTRRPSILTTVELLGKRWEIELTLAGRDEMGFRMLLGRQALRRRFVVDPGRSYIGGRSIAASINAPSTKAASSNALEKGS